MILWSGHVHRRRPTVWSDSRVRFARLVEAEELSITVQMGRAELWDMDHPVRSIVLYNLPPKSLCLG